VVKKNPAEAGHTQVKKRRNASLHLEISGGFFAAVGHDVVFDLCPFGNRTQSSALNSRDVQEDILSAAVRLNEAVSLGRVEPFNSACGHLKSPVPFR
jgi:hypothetical protein